MGNMSIVAALLLLCALQQTSAAVAPGQNVRDLLTSIQDAQDSIGRLDSVTASVLVTAETGFINNLNYMTANEVYEIINLFRTFRVPNADIIALEAELDSAMHEVTVKMTEQLPLGRKMRSVALTTWHHLDTRQLSLIDEDEELIAATESEILLELGIAEQLAKNFSQSTEASIDAISATLSASEQVQISQHVEMIKLFLSSELSTLENARFALLDAAHNTVLALRDVLNYLPK